MEKGAVVINLATAFSPPDFLAIAFSPPAFCLHIAFHKECFEMGMFNKNDNSNSKALDNGEEITAKNRPLCAGKKHRQCCFGSEDNPRWDDQIEVLDDKCAAFQEGAKCMKIDYCTEDIGVRKKGKCVGSSNRVCCVPHQNW